MAINLRLAAMRLPRIILQSRLIALAEHGGPMDLLSVRLAKEEKLYYRRSIDKAIAAFISLTQRYAVNT